MNVSPDWSISNTGVLTGSNNYKIKKDTAWVFASSFVADGN